MERPTAPPPMMAWVKSADSFVDVEKGAERGLWGFWWVGGGLNVLSARRSMFMCGMSV